MSTALSNPSRLDGDAKVAHEQRPLLLALGVATFMVALDGRVVAPLLPTIASDFGTSIASASWLVSGYMLPYGLCQLAYGPLADRFGKVRVATHAMLAFSVGTALCGAFPSFAMIVLLRALTGAAAAALIPLTIAYIGDTVPYGQRQAALAMLMASSGAAQAFSTSAGGTIAALVSWRTVFPILGALAGAATLALFAFRHRELRVRLAADAPSPRYRDALRAPHMRPLLGLVALEGFLYMGGFSFLSGLLAQRFGLNAFDIGMILGVAGVSQLAAARLLPRILRRLSERALMLCGGSMMSGAFLLSAFASHPSLVALASGLVGTGFTLCHTTLQTRATEAFPRARGTALALFAFSLFSGSALGTVCVGYASEVIGYTRTFLLAGVALLVFTAILVRVLGTRRSVNTTLPLA
jgi:predicted MFS family arabinose efflux permease